MNAHVVTTHNIDHRREHNDNNDTVNVNNCDDANRFQYNNL